MVKADNSLSSVERKRKARLSKDTLRFLELSELDLILSGGVPSPDPRGRSQAVYCEEY